MDREVAIAFVGAAHVAPRALVSIRQRGRSNPMDSPNEPVRPRVAAASWRRAGSSCVVHPWRHGTVLPWVARWLMERGVHPEVWCQRIDC